VAGVVAAIIGLAGETDCVTNAQDQPPPPPAAAVPADNPTPADSIPAADSAPLPPNIYPSSPLAQVIRLIQAGVSDDVVMTYATNSGSTFNLDSDKII